MFTVLAAVDFHQKCNFEFNFPAVPTVTELRDRLEAVLTTEAALRRPAGVPVTAFQIHRLQVFDERMEMWVDLVSSSQLTDYCQAYVFQKESPWHKDTPGRIPPPVRPSQPLGGAPPGAAAASPAYGSPHSPLHAGAAPLAAPALVHESIARAAYAAAAASPAYGAPPPGAAASAYGASPQLAVQPASPLPYGSSMAPVVESVRVSPQRMHAEPVLALPPAEVAPELVTHAEKVRVVYDELDKRKSRAVSLEDWCDLFTRLRLGQPDGPFSTETLEDLFREKADRNRDGFVSFTEFQMFGEMYPKLLDSLYFRCRDQVHHDSRAANIEAAEALQADLERRRDDSEAEVHESAGAVASAQQKEEFTQEGVDAAKEREREARAAKDEAHSQTEEVRQRLRVSQGDRDKVKEQVRQRDSHVRSAQRAVETAQKKQRNQESELDKSRKELERLQRLVEQQVKEVERQEGLVADAGGAIEQAQQKVADEEAEKGQVETELQAAQDAVQTVEDEMRSALEQENQLGVAHREAAKEANQLQSQKAQEDQELNKAKAREAQKKAALERATKALDEHEKVLEALRTKDRDLQDRRDAEEAKENEILDGEVRLREQRDCMEKKEEALRNAHNDFTSEAGRAASPARGQYATGLSA